MIARPHHVLRDVFILTLPVAIILCYLFLSSLESFYNAELRNFHGYLARGLRVGTVGTMLRKNVRRYIEPSTHRYFSDVNVNASPVRVFDLLVRGSVLDKLGADLPGSGREWEPAQLVENKEAEDEKLTAVENEKHEDAENEGRKDTEDKKSKEVHDVDVRHRGQRMENFFWSEKSWKIKTGKRGLIDGYRTINLTQFQGRLDNHLTFMVATTLGLPVPQSRVAWLFLNREDQGLYLQEEQIDESMIRRTGRMPGDIFYGEVFVPDEPKLSSDDIFTNPFLWEKKARNNVYADEYRPYLTEMLDWVGDEDPGSFDRLFEVLDRDLFVRHFAVIAFQGDQHIDHSHNHKYYFNPLTGRFEPIVWNARLNMPRRRGVESMANRLYRKVCRDPRFLDDVHQVMVQELIAGQATESQLQEIDRLLQEVVPIALRPGETRRYLENMKRIVSTRGQTVRGWQREGRVCFQSEVDTGVRRCRVWARGTTSLRLTALELAGAADGVEVLEDRDGDGQKSKGDRSFDVTVDGSRIEVRTPDALLYVGRDFRAPYHEALREGAETFTVHRQYTQLAYLESSLLLLGPEGQPVPDVVQLHCERARDRRPVDCHRGPADDYVATETVHPWRMPKPPEPRRIPWAGEVVLEKDLSVTEADQLEVESGTVLRLGPGVSVSIKCAVNLSDLTVRRSHPDKPWGVFVLQGAGASGSVLERCDFEGGSNDTLEHVYYSGMFSVHYADDVVVRDCRFADNIFGDDTVRFAKCDNLRMENVEVSGANGDAIDCDLSTGLIVDTTVISPRNDGIDLMTANVDLTRITVEDAGDKGMSLGESANPHVRDSSLRRCQIGVAIKDGSDPVIEGVEIQACELGVGSYDKNWRYPGGGRGRLVNCTLSGNEMDVLLTDDSRLVLEDCTTEQRFSVPDDDPDRLIIRTKSLQP